MKRFRHFHFFCSLFAPILAALLPRASAADELPLDKIRLPPGFAIELLARVPNARQMALSDTNVLYVGSLRAGKVHALPLDRDYRPGRLHVVADKLKMPAGVAWRQGSLYISAVNRIVRLDGIDRRLDDPPRPVVVRDDLPHETQHGWKFIAFGPDGWLYVPVGAPCNICEPDPERYAAILRLSPDGKELQTFARGVRNSVGFDWHPATGALWFTDNGRDWLGDESPPDELNHAPKPGLHFGYPYCHGSTLADPGFGEKRACREFTPPAQKLGAHVAALGMRFYRRPPGNGDTVSARRGNQEKSGQSSAFLADPQFPAAWRNRIFIAEHGSWNRSQKTGYRVSVVTLDGRRAVAYAPFASGWLQGGRNGSAWGRPADVLVLPDGSLLVSDDLAGAIYRIRYAGER